MKRALALLLLVLLLWPTSADAGWRYSSSYRSGYSWYGYSYNYGGYSYPPGYWYYEPVVVTQYVPVYNYIPVAFSTYNPGAVTAGTTLTLSAATPVTALQAQPQVPLLTSREAAAQFDAGTVAGKGLCEKNLAALEKRLAALEGKSPAQVISPTAQQKGIVAVMTTNCGKCHEAAVAEKEGAGFVLLKDGQLAPLTDRQALSCYRQVISGKMPKSGKLSEEDGQAILAWLDKLQTGNGK